MGETILEIPGQVSASSTIPLPQLEMELRRRLVAEMYGDELVGGSAACMLAGLEKSEFQHWLGKHLEIQPLSGSDYELERRNLEEWLTDA